MFDQKQLTKFPTDPGVYLMRDGKGEILYVGKAINLRNRVKQYFAKGGDGRPQIPYLMARVEKIDTIVVSSEKEALILENNLIKEHQPKYNIFLKDDKGYISLKLTKHKWPMIQLVRYKGEPPKDGTYFGPYTNTYAAKQTLELLIRLFPLRRCSDQELARRTRPCLLYQIKRCIAPCVGKCAEKEYQELVKRTTRFLQGKDREVLEILYKEMEEASEQLNFERAGELHATIHMIERTLEEQKVEQAGSGDRDVIGFYAEGGEISISQLLFRSGKLLGSQHFHFSGSAQEDEDLLGSFLLQHYKESTPKEILLPFFTHEAVGEILETKISIPQRGQKRELTEMACANAASAFKRERDPKALRERTLMELQEHFHLMNYPRRIECFDNSNLSGSEPVAGMIAFTDGEKDKKRYRKFRLKTGSDDYAGMHEALTRRLKRGQNEDDLPDLLILDGGKGQLGIAERVLSDLNIVTVDCIAIAKEEGRHDKGMTSEQIFRIGHKEPVSLKKHVQLLYFLQQVRDEAHRFALSFQQKRREKKLLVSKLDAIPGIGPKKKKLLLTHFGSVKRILKASREELGELKGLTKADVEQILKLR